MSDIASFTVGGGGSRGAGPAESVIIGFTANMINKPKRQAAKSAILERDNFWKY